MFYYILREHPYITLKGADESPPASYEYYPVLTSPSQWNAL